MRLMRPVTSKSKSHKQIEELKQRKRPKAGYTRGDVGLISQTSGVSIVDETSPDIIKNNSGNEPISEDV